MDSGGKARTQQQGRAQQRPASTSHHLGARRWFVAMQRREQNKSSGFPSPAGVSCGHRCRAPSGDNGVSREDDDNYDAASSHLLASPLFLLQRRNRNGHSLSLGCSSWSTELDGNSGGGGGRYFGNGSPASSWPVRRSDLEAMVGDGLRSGLRFAAGDGWLVDSDLEAMDDDGWPADSDLKAMDGSG
nr:hypothetical protein Iba_scaffold489CG0260 [Ipomoea batatas]